MKQFMGYGLSLCSVVYLVIGLVNLIVIQQNIRGIAAFSWQQPYFL